MSKWISVKDKKPSNMRMVICYTPCDKYMFVGFCNTYKQGEKEKTDWKIITAMRGTKTVKKKVTHWMPLPELPEED